MESKKQILIVDDDDSFRKELYTLLSSDFKLSEAPNGNIARNLIKLHKFDLIISDDQMPFLTGRELLEWVKMNSPTKFILMTHHSRIIENKNIPELHPDFTLIKPFVENDLLEAIDKLLHLKNETQNETLPLSLDNQFCKVPISDFVSEKEYKYDIFIRITEVKYIKIAHKGGKIDLDRINAFHEKSIYYFYVHKKDFNHLVNFTVNFSKAVNQSSFIEKKKKIRFFRYTGELVLQNLFLNEINSTTLLYAKNFTQLSLESLCEQDELFLLLNGFNEHIDDLYAHSLAVAVVSVAIAQALGWSRQSILFKVALSGILHDIGLKEIPQEILNKPRAQLTQKEVALFETHPMRGKEILETFKNIPTDIISVAYEHHENILANGYPRRISKSQIHPITHIVKVADLFAQLTVKNPNYPVPMNPQSAFKQIEFGSRDLVNDQCLNALKSIVSAS